MERPKIHLPAANDSAADPLEKPAALTETTSTFLRHFQLNLSQNRDPQGLSAVAEAFSRIPYENLTKILKHEQSGVALRGPKEVIHDHVRLQTGGTCFSLTAAMLHIVRSLGWQAEPILADRHYGQDTHCALLVWVNGRPHLLDPGYLIIQPVAVDGSKTTTIEGRFNRLVLTPDDSAERLILETEQQGQRVRRLTFKLQPADPGQFLKAWRDSFSWDMMRYPLLTRVAGNQQIYLQNHKLQLRDLESVRRSEVDGERLVEEIVAQFGVHPSVVQNALATLKRHGESIG